MSHPRRIVAAGARRGGVGDVFTRAVSELRTRGHVVEVVPIPATGAPGRAGLRAAWRARSRLRAAEVVHLELGCNDSEVFWFALVAVCLRDDCVLIAHDHPELAHRPGAALLTRRSRLSSVLAYRAISPLVDRAAVRLLLARAGVLAVFGERAAHERREQGAVAVQVIHHGADPPRPGPPPSEADGVLFTGFIGPGKGVDVLLEAWAQLGGQPPLTLAGAVPRPSEAWLAEHLERLPEGGPRPLVLGAVEPEEEFQRLIAAAAIVVLPYRRASPASGILVRAMSAGRAIVATRTQATEGVLVDGENALVVAPGDVAGLAQAIRRLSLDPAERDRLGAAAARTAAKLFSWERHIADLEGAYAHAVSARRRP